MAPSHLVVLQHGLYGGPMHLTALADELMQRQPRELLVHQARSNEGLTRDGVAAGGERLAAEIREVVARESSLESITLVGNSLGGLYVRHAAASLLEGSGDDATMAGLRPDALVTTGCPHLGVRRYTYLPVPRWLRPAGVLIAGATADDLLLRDASRLLVEMSVPSSAFGEALGVFSRRRCYANLRGDFMVPFGSAAIETAPWGWGVDDEQHARAFASRAGVAFTDDAVVDGRKDGIGVVCEARAEAMRLPRRRRQSEWIDDENDDGGESGGLEELMRSGLHAHGWSKVGIGFASATATSPLAHNRLVALRREAGWRQGFGEWVERTQEGAFVMADCAEYIAGGGGGPPVR